MSFPGFGGGGIGGLCLAVALSKYPDIQVDLYEAAERFKEIGAGVMIWERTWKILSLLGMASDFSRIAHAPPDGSLGVGFDYRKSDQPMEGFRFYLFQLPYGCICFHRAHFLDVLVEHLPDGVANFGKRLISYSRNGPHNSVVLQFADGATAACDILVGCDGIKSTVRKQLLEEKARDGHPELLGLIDPMVGKPNDSDTYDGALFTYKSMCYHSDGLSSIVARTSYSISRGSVVNVVALVSQPEKRGHPFTDPWVVECTTSEVLDCYAGWEPEVEELLKHMKNPMRWAIHELRPLPLYVANNIALLGDAAHAMAPHQGAGAGQAIEDAFVLAHLLGDPTTSRSDIPVALLAYQYIRLPLASHVQKESYMSGMMYEFSVELAVEDNARRRIGEGERLYASNLFCAKTMQIVKLVANNSIIHFN
ncbi:Salicylate hydroxylase [Grifola frondosa]|uniref:Salicylate hydroxylase n=1 Tax=Grifola frondosa TaxID=5627 RepID=A0A1C7M1V2_GRIFR|nr:Salicylate hydroxylase [Grifola frondosa]